MNISPILPLRKLRSKAASASTQGYTAASVRVRTLALEAVVFSVKARTPPVQERREGGGPGQSVSHLQDLALPEGELLFPSVRVG